MLVDRRLKEIREEVLLETLARVVLESGDRRVDAWLYVLAMIEKMDIRKGAVSKQHLARLAHLFAQQEPGFFSAGVKALP